MHKLLKITLFVSAMLFMQACATHQNFVKNITAGQDKILAISYNR